MTTPTTPNNTKELPKMGKTKTAIRSLILGKEAAIAAEQAELAELRKQEEWAAGEEHRARVAAIAARATQLADGAAADAAAIKAAVVDLEAAARRVHELGSSYNGALSAVHADLVAENVPVHSGGSVPPSPVHAGVAPATNGGIRIGDINIHTIGTGDLVDQAIAAAKTTEPAAYRFAVTTVAPPLEGRYWRHGGNGSVHRLDSGPTKDANGPTFTELTRPEYLAHEWRLDLRDLPEHVLAELTTVERARLAEKLLPPGDAA